jgi:predicted NBD/HSP70 family sugar kinase
MSDGRARERSALRVLDFLWREGPANRVDVVRATDLSRATVSKLIGELQAQGLVAQRRVPVTTAGRSGRPPALLELNPGIATIGGVDFGHSSVRVAIADLAGRLIAETRHELDVDNEAERSIDLAVSSLQALISAAGVPAEQLLGVGAAISAPVKRDSGSLAAAGVLPGWSAISPKLELQRRLGVPVHVGNDANLGALAEVRTGAARGAANVVYLMLSSGIGGGLVLNGSLFTGHSGMTGELGHVVVDPAGERCRCGNRGCLETIAGAEHLLAALRPSHGPQITLAAAAARARAGDERCRELFHNAGRVAGRVVGAVCNLINPELVIVGGDLIVAAAAVVGGVKEGLALTSLAAVRQDLRVVAATLGDRAELLGAIGLAIAEADIATIARAGSGRHRGAPAARAISVATASAPEVPRAIV